MSMPNEFAAHAKRFAACMAGAVVLAMMVGTQQGNPDDFGSEFRQSVLHVRIVGFLVVGVLLYLAISYWSKIVPYFGRPGIWAIASGLAAVVAGRFLMRWYDPLGDGKFSGLASAVADTPSLDGLTRAYFGWLWWVEMVAVLIGLLAVIVTVSRVGAILTAVLSLFAATVSYTAHAAVVATQSATDHSLGWAASSVGYLVLAGSVLLAAFSGPSAEASRARMRAVLAWRPGSALVVAGAVIGVLSLVLAHWFSPANLNADLSQTASLFRGQGLNAVSSAFLSWLAYVLLALSALGSAAAAYLRHRVLGWVVVALGILGVGIDLHALYSISKIGGAQHFDGSTGPWQNLGTGGWVYATAAFLFGSAGLVVATADRTTPSAESVASPSRAARGRDALRLSSAPGMTRSLIMVAVAVALFYPPTATAGWRTIIVGEIGLAMFLALGLNVVVGWAGLLDLGFIAFYAIGSYTTAYLVGALPVTPPSWLHMSPLWAIPFAVVVCLVAGVLLGAPTLRLRGDYLAIVTLGFGEIIHLIALNNPGDFTNGSEGPPKPIPHPVIHIGGLKLQWGLERLQYWYMLLVLVGIVVLLFRRLENSRLGRAWAAIREDEVAAQASGVNTTRVKLLAFAIGASTSGIAGVFNASMVGSFAPDNFLLNNSILIVAYVVFGGMGSITGAMAGAAALTWLPRFLQDQVPQADQYMWIGLVIILMMIFRSAGLIPAKRRAEELGGLDVPDSAEPRAVPAGEGL